MKLLISLLLIILCISCAENPASPIAEEPEEIITDDFTATILGKLYNPQPGQRYLRRIEVEEVKDQALSGEEINAGDILVTVFVDYINLAEDYTHIFHLEYSEGIWYVFLVGIPNVSGGE